MSVYFVISLEMVFIVAHDFLVLHGFSGVTTLFEGYLGLNLPQRSEIFKAFRIKRTQNT